MTTGSLRLLNHPEIGIYIYNMLAYIYIIYHINYGKIKNVPKHQPVETYCQTEHFSQLGRLWEVPASTGQVCPGRGR
jgi:hypothetical protein